MTARLFALASDALNAVVNYYAAAGVELPDRRLVSLGQAPWDCPLVNVWVARDYPNAGDVTAEQAQPLRRHPGHVFRAAVVAVQIARCYPTGDGEHPPDIYDEETAAEAVYADADLMWRALIEAQDARTFSGPNGVAFEGWTAVGPSGGFGGGLLTVRALPG